MASNYPKRLTLLSTQVASSSATIDFTQISSNYTVYYLKIRKILPATDNTELNIRFSTDGGSTFLSTATYQLNTQAFDSGNTNQSDRAIAADHTCVCNHLSNVSTEPAYADIVFYDLNDGVLCPRWMSRSIHTNAIPRAEVCYSTGSNSGTTAVNAIRVYFSSGNIASGTFYFYGCNEGGLLY